MLKGEETQLNYLYIYIHDFAQLSKPKKEEKNYPTNTSNMYSSSSPAQDVKAMQRTKNKKQKNQKKKKKKNLVSRHDTT